MQPEHPDVQQLYLSASRMCRVIRGAIRDGLITERDKGLVSAYRALERSIASLEDSE